MAEKSDLTDFLKMRKDSPLQSAPHRPEGRASDCISSSAEKIITTLTNPPFRGLGGRFSTAYLPPLSYFSALLHAENVWLEACENYVKQSYRNRCRIAATNGIETLSIPVESRNGQKAPIRDVRISSHGNWQLTHWRAITSAYRNSPFFEYFEDDFRPFYEKRWTFLWDYNLDLLTLVLKLLDAQPKIQLTEKYDANPLDSNDLREIIHPKKEPVFISKPYYQVFKNKHGFLTDLSIIDLIFNMGNEAILYLPHPGFEKD